MRIQTRKFLTKRKVEPANRRSDEIFCAQRAGSSPLYRANDLWEPKHGIHAGNEQEGEGGRDDHADNEREEQEHPEPCGSVIRASY